MANLVGQDLVRFETLLQKVNRRTANSNELKEFMQYLNSFAPYEVQDMLNQLRFKSIEEFNDYITRKTTDENITAGLVAIGVGILLAFLLKKK